VARENPRTWGAPAGRDLLATARWPEVVASGSTERSTGGEQETQRLEAAPWDTLDRSDPGGRVAGHCTDRAPVLYQATAVDLQGLGIEVHSSADHQVVRGQLERKKKHIEIRGLNKNCNHHLKSLFKSAAVVASSKPGPFEEFYAVLVAKGSPCCPATEHVLWKFPLWAELANPATSAM
jgi:hypothetical protein